MNALNKIYPPDTVRSVRLKLNSPLYTNNKAPLQLEYNNTDLGHKVGQASSHSFVGLFAFGDTSVQAAAKDGNIKVIKHTDYEFTNVFFGLFTKTTVYVYGD